MSDNSLKIHEKNKLCEYKAANPKMVEPLIRRWLGRSCEDGWGRQPVLFWKMSDSQAEQNDDCQAWAACPATFNSLFLVENALL
jgi:hypothetical protein